MKAGDPSPSVAPRDVGHHGKHAGDNGFPYIFLLWEALASKFSIELWDGLGFLRPHSHRLLIQ